MPSTVILDFIYLEETRILRVRFVSGTIYEYLDVPSEVIVEMKIAFSKGKFLNQFVKGRFRYRKIA